MLMFIVVGNYRLSNLNHEKKMSINQNKLDIQTLLDIIYLAYKCTQRFTDVNLVTLLMEPTRVIGMFGVRFV